MISKEIDFEEIRWEDTPYNGIHISLLDEEHDTDDTRTPKTTAHAIRVDPTCEIGIHYHYREEDWTEFIIFPSGGNFEFHGPNESNEFSGTNPVYVRINPRDRYGIRNRDQANPLFLVSIMKPGFSGYTEIRGNI